jgi:hypothetical protein
MRAHLKAILFALAIIVAVPAVSYAADSTPIRISRTPAVVAGAPDTVIIEGSSLLPPPEVRYGCKRIWRCDSVVCEWRRGCFGTYGYMEGPYYTLELAKRHWERHGWAGPGPGAR